MNQEDEKFIFPELCQGIKNLIENQDEFISQVKPVSNFSDATQIVEKSRDYSPTYHTIQKTIQIGKSATLFVDVSSTNVATIAFQPQIKNFYVYQVQLENSIFKSLPVTHIILENEKAINITAILGLEECVLLGTDNGVAIKIVGGSSFQQQISGSAITCFEKMKTMDLVLVGFCDHQVVIWDYEKCTTLWVFKEGFNIPLPLKYVRCQYKDDYFLSASEDGSITIWNLHQNMMSTLTSYVEQKLPKTVKLPKFDVVPYHKILNVLRTPLLFIELWGNFICTYEESQLFRMWVIEYQYKQYMTMAKFNIKDKNEKIHFMKIDELNEQLIMISSTKIYIYKFEKDWTCETIKIGPVDGSLFSLHFSNGIFINSSYKNEELKIQIAQLPLQEQREIDY